MWNGTYKVFQQHCSLRSARNKLQFLIMSARADISKFSSGRGCLVYLTLLGELFFIRSFFVGSSVNHSIRNIAYWFRVVARKFFKSLSFGLIFLFESTFSLGDSFVSRIRIGLLFRPLLGVVITDVTGLAPFHDLWFGVCWLNLELVWFLLNGFVSLFANCSLKLLSEEWRHGLSFSFNTLICSGVCPNSLTHDLAEIPNWIMGGFQPKNGQF